jgi:hypothetical protein
MPDPKIDIATCMMMYMSAQNDLSPIAQENIADIMASQPLQSIRLYIMDDTLGDGKRPRGTDEYHVDPNAKKFSAERLFKDEPVHKSTVFEWFLGRARQDFSRYNPMQKILLFWGHGGGMVMLDEELPGQTKTERTTVVAFIDVLEEQRREIRFDIIAFDSCYMSVIETLNDFTDVAQFVLVSSAAVDASGYPYLQMTNNLKHLDVTYTPEKTAQMICKTYDAHYAEMGALGRKYLYACNTEKIGQCAEALNNLGLVITALLNAAPDGAAIAKLLENALTEAHIDHSYVAVLNFLAAFEARLEAMDQTSIAMKNLRAAISAQRSTVRAAFYGQLGEAGNVPTSPLIWCPVMIDVFMRDEAMYNKLNSSKNGHGGWVSMWRKYHGITDIANADSSKRSKFGSAIRII